MNEYPEEEALIKAGPLTFRKVKHSAWTQHKVKNGDLVFHAKASSGHSYQMYAPGSGGVHVVHRTPDGLPSRLYPKSGSGTSHGSLREAKAACAAHHALITARHMNRSIRPTNQEENTVHSEGLFEEIFKSETDECCPTCGGDVEVVEKGGKKKLKAKGKGMAKQIGNEMAPHKGPASGQVSPPRTGSLGSAVDRNHSSKPRKPASGIVKALFPSVDRVQLVEYTGLASDAALAQQIEASQDPTKAHQLFTPSARNMEMERASTEMVAEE